ncbi:purine nucleoside permease [Paenochrobactrum glaciei]|uniref:Purine nucleoside permease n=1 Tax=Paenochrobactrum glaciei TaxID=486407 RepID=A0ABP3QXE5_9HYPH
MKTTLNTSIALGALLAGVSFAQAEEKIAPKVMIITMFGQEAKPWLDGEKFTKHIALPGLSAEYPNVDCTDAGLCHVTTSMGLANAASTISAVTLSNQFDLTKTYFLIAGIAGVDPEQGTLGSALWAKYSVNSGLNHRIDLREAPEGWSTDSFPLGANSPEEKAKWSAGSEVYALNPALADYAFETTKNVELIDGDGAKEYRKHYTQKAALGTPHVGQCDTLSSDTYWHGTKLAEAMAKWVSLFTDGKANYCTSQMEDNATLTALKRGADAKLLDFDRIALLRTASNFDRQGQDQTPLESLKDNSGGFALATTNAYRVGKTYAESIIKDWDKWADAPQVKAAQ